MGHGDKKVGTCAACKYALQELDQEPCFHCVWANGEKSNWEAGISLESSNCYASSGPQSPVIDKPAHYLAGRDIEPIAVIEDWDLPHHLACALKYIARAGRKDDTKQDLEKAVWYLRRYIDEVL